MSLKFHCTLDQLLTAAEERLGVRNPVVEDENDAQSLLRALLGICTRKVVAVDCHFSQSAGSDDGTVIVAISQILPVHENDTEFPAASDDEFREIVKNLQSLIFLKDQR